MRRSQFFFERKEFSDEELSQPYYSYRGYYLVENNGKKHHPISLYFGKDEIAIYYTKNDGKVLKVFSLCVGEGEINQAMLSKKIEDYALMPLWPLSDDLLKEELLIDHDLLKMSFFCSYHGFEYKGKQFQKVSLAGSNQKRINIIEPEKKQLEVTPGNDKENDRPNRLMKLLTYLTYILGDNKKKDKSIANGLADGEKEGRRVDVWKIDEKGKIKTSKINFLMILLDFLFELDFANTFEDKNFFKLQPHIQNNLVLDALTKKNRYLSELNKLRTEKVKPLPKRFKNIETDWLNVCRIENYKLVFVSPNSLFDDPEIEVKNLCFEARIGEGRKRRKKYLKTREDAHLKNEICTFFMQKYNIWSAFRILMPACAIIIVACLLLAIPLGDHCLDCVIEKSDGLAGIFSVGLPMAIFLFMLVYYRSRGINLFKLLLPRLFLGIMIGWSVFWSTEELWKKALTTSASMVLVFDVFLLIIIFMYIFTDIANRMYRRADWRVFFKSVNLIGMALVISFVIGFYVIQFFAKPMIENSGFLQNERIYNNKFPEKKGSKGDNQHNYFARHLMNYLVKSGKGRYTMMLSILLAQMKQSPECRITNLSNLL